MKQMTNKEAILLPQLPGVYTAKKKDGTIYYRASFTYKSKHISLGSYPLESSAGKAYETAVAVLREQRYHIEDYKKSCGISFDKWVVLMNLRDNGIYFKNPIYIKKRYFIYYVNKKVLLKFDVDDLFYYANHKIMKRGGHLFVSDYGMQVNILSRYGIRNHAVPGRDYSFVNGDDTDYRYGNIDIINAYYGVTKSYYKGLPIFTTKIHINGDFIVGRYSTEIEAAIAYNKAAGIIRNKGVLKDFTKNYIPDLGEIEYAKIFNLVRISKKIREY
jgi:hypothetical protein